VTATAVGSYATQSALAAMIGGGQTFDGTDTTLQGLICDRVNQLLESEMHQVAAPISSATYIYDGRGLRHLYLPFPIGAASVGIGGLRAASLVEVQANTGAGYTTVAAGDYFLRGQAPMNGPFRWLVLSDLPTGLYNTWPDGYATVRVTATAGWAAIPDDLTMLALNIAQRAWNARQSGMQSIDGVDENGRPLVARFMGIPDWRTLKRYTVSRQSVIVGTGRTPALPLSRANW
jgi:hypothetical protein